MESDEMHLYTELDTGYRSLSALINEYVKQNAVSADKNISFKYKTHTVLCVNNIPYSTWRHPIKHPSYSSFEMDINEATNEPIMKNSFENALIANANELKEKESHKKDLTPGLISKYRIPSNKQRNLALAYGYVSEIDPRSIIIKSKPSSDDESRYNALSLVTRLNSESSEFKVSVEVCRNPNVKPLFYAIKEAYNNSFMSQVKPWCDDLQWRAIEIPEIRGLSFVTKEYDEWVNKIKQLANVMNESVNNTDYLNFIRHLLQVNCELGHYLATFRDVGRNSSIAGNMDGYLEYVPIMYQFRNIPNPLIDVYNDLIKSGVNLLPNDDADEPFIIKSPINYTLGSKDLTNGIHGSVKSESWYITRNDVRILQKNNLDLSETLLADKEDFGWKEFDPFSVTDLNNHLTLKNSSNKPIDHYDFRTFYLKFMQYLISAYQSNVNGDAYLFDYTQYVRYKLFRMVLNTPNKKKDENNDIVVDTLGVIAFFKNDNDTEDVDDLKEGTSDFNKPEDYYLNRVKSTYEVNRVHTVKRSQTVFRHKYAETYFEYSGMLYYAGVPIEEIPFTEENEDGSSEEYYGMELSGNTSEYIVNTNLNEEITINSDISAQQRELLKMDNILENTAKMLSPLHLAEVNKVTRISGEDIYSNNIILNEEILKIKIGFTEDNFNELRADWNNWRGIE